MCTKAYTWMYLCIKKEIVWHTLEVGNSCKSRPRLMTWPALAVAIMVQDGCIYDNSVFKESNFHKSTKVTDLFKMLFVNRPLKLHHWFNGHCLLCLLVHLLQKNKEINNLNATFTIIMCTSATCLALWKQDERSSPTISRSWWFSLCFTTSAMFVLCCYYDNTN